MIIYKVCKVLSPSFKGGHLRVPTVRDRGVNEEYISRYFSKCTFWKTRNDEL